MKILFLSFLLIANKHIDISAYYSPESNRSCRICLWIQLRSSSVFLRWATISSRQKRWNNSFEYSAFYLSVCRCHNLIIDWFIVWVFVCIRPLYGYRLVANRITGPGLLSFIVDEDVRVHVHATNEIPSTVEANIAAEVFYGTRKEIIFKIVEMVNDQNVENVPIEYRKCRFTSERVTADVVSIYEYYGHSTCTVECLRQFQRKLCNCTQHPLSQRNETPCDVNGFICLTKNFGKFFNFSFIECMIGTSSEFGQFNRFIDQRQG